MLYPIFKTLSSMLGNSSNSSRNPNILPLHKRLWRSLLVRKLSFHQCRFTCKRIHSYWSSNKRYYQYRNSFSRFVQFINDGKWNCDVCRFVGSFTRYRNISVGSLQLLLLRTAIHKYHFKQICATWYQYFGSTLGQK